MDSLELDGTRSILSFDFLGFASAIIKAGLGVLIFGDFSLVFLVPVFVFHPYPPSSILDLLVPDLIFLPNFDSIELLDYERIDDDLTIKTIFCKFYLYFYNFHILHFLN